MSRTVSLSYRSTLPSLPISYEPRVSVVSPSRRDGTGGRQWVPLLVAPAQDRESGKHGRFNLWAGEASAVSPSYTHSLFSVGFQQVGDLSTRSLSGCPNIASWGLRTRQGRPLCLFSAFPHQPDRGYARRKQIPHPRRRPSLCTGSYWRGVSYRPVTRALTRISKAQDVESSLLERGRHHVQGGP